MLRDRAAILDIYRAGKETLIYADELTRSELETDGMRVSAILYQVLIIGEATKRLSQEFRDGHPEIPWSSMAGMRDIVAHHYDEIDFNVLWNVLKRGIPEMMRNLEPLLPESSE